MIKALFLGVGVSIALLACSSSTTTSGASGGCADLVAAQNAAEAKCNRSATAPDRQSEEEARQIRSCQNFVNAPGSRIAPGALSACAEQQRLSCDAECDAVFAPGTLPNGAACGVSSQCASGACNTPLLGCGTCVPEVSIGGACTGAECAKGLGCTFKGGETKGTCVAALVEGDVCEDPEQSWRCAKGLTCKAAGGGPRKCTKVGVAGEACAAETDCVSDLACLSNKCGARLPEGAPCADSGNCAAGACSKTTKKCIPFEYVATGAACDSYAKRCARGSCRRTGDSADGTCVDPIADGAPCTAAQPFEGGCDTAALCINGTCQIFDPATCK